MLKKQMKQKREYSDTLQSSLVHDLLTSTKGSTIIPVQETEPDSEVSNRDHYKKNTVQTLPSLGDTFQHDSYRDELPTTRLKPNEKQQLNLSSLMLSLHKITTRLVREKNRPIQDPAAVRDQIELAEYFIKKIKNCKVQKMH